MNNQSQRGRLSANILVNGMARACQRINAHLIHKISCSAFRTITRLMSVSLGGIASSDIALGPIQIYVRFRVGEFRDNSPEGHKRRPHNPYTEEVNKNRMSVHSLGKIDSDKQSGERNQAQEE
jgi:hypothetical protein